MKVPTPGQEVRRLVTHRVQRLLASQHPVRDVNLSSGMYGLASRAGHPVIDNQRDGLKTELGHEPVDFGLRFLECHLRFSFSLSGELRTRLSRFVPFSSIIGANWRLSSDYGQVNKHYF